MSLTMELKSDLAKYTVGNVVSGGGSVRAHLAIFKEVDDSFSVIVLNLPGCASCGDNEVEAIANVREAVASVMDGYKEINEEIPWVDEIEYEAVPSGASFKWIMVNA